MPPIPSVDIRALDGSEPSEQFNSWKEFLASCEVRDRYEGVIYYGSVNCNYILFPCGTVVKSYGFHGEQLMREIRCKGRELTLSAIKSRYNELVKASDDLYLSIDQLCQSFDTLDSVCHSVCIHNVRKKTVPTMPKWMRKV